jgi:hypothetical protein
MQPGCVQLPAGRQLNAPSHLGMQNGEDRSQPTRTGSSERNALSRAPALATTGREVGLFRRESSADCGWHEAL